MIEREFEIRQTLIVINDLIDSEVLPISHIIVCNTFPISRLLHNSKSVDFPTELYS